MIQCALSDELAFRVGMAHGKTYDSALANIKEAMELWINTAKAFNDPIPVPKGRRLVFE